MEQLSSRPSNGSKHSGGVGNPNFSESNALLNKQIFTMYEHRHDAKIGTNFNKYLIMNWRMFLKNSGGTCCSFGLFLNYLSF